MIRMSHVAIATHLFVFSNACGESTAGIRGHDTRPPPTDAADAADASDTTHPADAADTSPDAALEPFHVVAAGLVSRDLRSTSAVCVGCHTTDATATAMRDATGRDISPVALWQGTMKANAARDPFFRATLSAERARFPEHVAAIDAKCLACHAPLASMDAKLAGTTPAFEDLAVANERGLLGADGVTCTACHGIAADKAGEPETWSGRALYDPSGRVFGPHTAPFEEPMRNQTAVVPAYGAHMLESAQCASCHTLVTHALDLPDAPDFNEQTPWLEWSNSDFARQTPQTTCQDCHMPKSDMDGVPIVTRIARRPMGGDFPRVAPRSPYGRHLFVGGNTLIPEVLKRYRDALLPSASDAAFDAVIAATREQLSEHTASLTLADARIVDGRLEAVIRVGNLTGHKFPSGYPSRRAWLRITVRDAAGAVLFMSGAWNSEGMLVDDAGAVLASELPGGPYLPHRTVVRGDDDVVVWEAIMGDRDGKPTISLLRAVNYLKDNRFLPTGWTSDGPHAERTRAIGVESDMDFVAGSDAVRLDLPAMDTARSVEVQLAYQVLGARWAAELFEVMTPDVRVFQAMTDDVGLDPVIVGIATITL